jgi:hypothetical protein
MTQTKFGKHSFWDLKCPPIKFLCISLLGYLPFGILYEDSVYCNVKNAVSFFESPQRGEIDHRKESIVLDKFFKKQFFAPVDKKGRRARALIKNARRFK